MRRVLLETLVIVWCATGCFSDRGVAIEVDVGQTGAASVELYIGKTTCEGCKTITPPAATCALRDQAWFRDDAERSTARVQGHTATFRLESATARTLPIVIAVGLDASGGAVATATLFDLDVPVNHGQIATTTLVAANPVTATKTDLKTVNEDRVQVWTNKQTPPGACVVVEHWRPGVDPQRDSVVPAEDPECNDGMPTSSLPTTSYCVATPAADEACMLGIRTCNLDGSIGAGCAQLAKQVCVPDQLCNSGCTDLGCIGMKLATLSGPRIDCTIPVALDGGSCSGATGQVNLDAQLPDGCGHQPLIGTVPLGGFAPSGPLSGATIQLGTTSSRCRFPISANGTVSGAFDAHGLIRLETKNAALLLPIQIKFAKVGCTDQLASCSVTGDTSDKLWTCGG